MIFKFYYLLTILAFTFVSQFNFAQWKVGMQTGINISTYVLENKAEDVEISNKTGLIIGGNVNYAFNEQFEINSGLRYIQKGARVVFDMPTLQADNKINFIYLELPTYLRYSFLDGSFKHFIIAGFDFSYLILAKSEGVINGNPNEEDLTTEFTKKFEVSIDGGIGIEYEANSFVSYALSSNYSLAVIKPDQYLTNRGLQLAFSLLFKI